MKALKRLAAAALAVCLAVTLSAAAPLLPFAKAAGAGPSVGLRVEGQRSTLYSGDVAFTPGEDFYDILTSALKAKDIPVVSTDGSYGHEIDSIGGESGAYPVWWHLYVNGKASDVGVDTLRSENGDEIVLYLGDDSEVLFPTLTFSPKSPVAGGDETINVSATYTDYTDASDPVVKTAEIGGVAITFDGSSYLTDKDGNAVVRLPAAGSYTLTATKEQKDSTPAIVRTGDIPVTVYAAGSAPSGTGDGLAPSNPAPSPADISSVKEAVSAGAARLSSSGAGDWGAALALRAAGFKVPQSFIESARQDIAAGGTSLPTHLAGVVIGLKAAGADPSSFDGKNLVSQLYSSKKIGESGLNGYAYGLLALDCGDYAVPAKEPVGRASLIDSILSYQLPGGAFALDRGSPADSDMTAIAVTALSPYTGEKKVSDAVNSAVGYLSRAQTADGGYLPSYSADEESESTAQVIIALSSVGIDASVDARFVKNGHSALDALMGYRRADGFAHTKTGGTDLMATEQAVTALSAYLDRLDGGARVYDLTSTAVSPDALNGKVNNPDTGGEAGLDGGLAACLAAAVAGFAAVALRRRRAR